jgi:hypothetical protein
VIKQLMKNSKENNGCQMLFQAPISAAHNRCTLTPPPPEGAISQAWALSSDV